METEETPTQLSGIIPKSTKPQPLPVTVEKATPYTFDLGNLLAFDSNPVVSTAEASLASTARDGAQALLNQLLTTCPIASTPSGVLLTLPAPTTPLPREKALPTEKPLTKWQQFAAKKGIKDKKKEGKMVYDETTGEWVPKWGYKGANKEGDSDWIVEVDDKKPGQEDAGGLGALGASRRERKERIKRQERRERANEKRGRKGVSS